MDTENTAPALQSSHSSSTAAPAEGNRLTFGIYPGGAAYLEDGATSGPPDDPARLDAALAQLQGGEGRPFVVRSYAWYTGEGRIGLITPAQVERYIHSGRELDLVLCYRTHEEGLKNWTRFIQETIRRYGPYLGILQIGEETNSTGPGGDGGFPNARQAVVWGVLAAKEEVLRQGLAVQIGFNATPSFPFQQDFWQGLWELGQAPFVSALDYVGLDFFPDVFRRVAPDGSPMDLKQSVEIVLKGYRELYLPTAHIPPSVPIHIGENGWPTNATRTYERQAQVLETIVRTIQAHSRALNITHYEHFCLRDPDSANPTFGYEFGLMRSDYAPKPAFETYRRLIRGS